MAYKARNKGRGITPQQMSTLFRLKVRHGKPTRQAYKEVGLLKKLSKKYGTDTPGRKFKFNKKYRNIDLDEDGKVNKWDCRPLNHRKQDKGTMKKDWERFKKGETKKDTEYGKELVERIKETSKKLGRNLTRNEIGYLHWSIGKQYKRDQQKKDTLKARKKKDWKKAEPKGKEKTANENLQYDIMQTKWGAWHPTEESTMTKKLRAKGTPNKIIRDAFKQREQNKKAQEQAMKIVGEHQPRMRKIRTNLLIQERRKKRAQTAYEQLTKQMKGQKNAVNKEEWDKINLRTKLSIKKKANKLHGKPIHKRNLLEIWGLKEDKE